MSVKRAPASPTSLLASADLLGERREDQIEVHDAVFFPHIPGGIPNSSQGDRSQNELVVGKGFDVSHLGHRFELQCSAKPKIRHVLEKLCDGLRLIVLP